jgi:hypothetical protein
MKRILFFAFAAALLGQAALVSAQDSGEPSVKSVLDAARAEYWGDKGAVQADEARPDPGAAAAPDAERPGRDFSYTPFLVSFVPGLSFPFGFFDTSIAGGMVGSLAHDVSGVEGSGVFNLARDLRGAQGAGVFNISRNLRGIQGAGVFNMAEDVHGFQAAGLFNVAGDVRGGQAAGLFNSAGHVSGVQIGVVNVAKSIDGAQIGLINIAGNGLSSLGLVYEPATSYAYAYWQAGTPSLYTIVGFGAPDHDWSCDFALSVASVGLGSRSRLMGLDIDADVSVEAAIGALPYGSFDWSGDWGAWEGWSMLRAYPSLKISAGLPLGCHVQLVAGLKADIDVDPLGNRVPESLKSGAGWKGRLFDEGFTVWPKWFFGLKL